MRVRSMLSVLAIVPAVGAAACSSGTGGQGTGAGPRDQHSSTPAPSSSSPAALPTTPVAASSTTTTAPAKPVRSVTVVSGSGDTYVIKVWAETQTTDCAAHAYGKIAEYLRKHACFGLHRVLAMTRVNNRPVAFAQRTIGFRGSPGDKDGYRAAGSFRTLVTKDGTGNLDDLLREGDRIPGGPKEVPFPNAFSALGQDNGVTVVEAWYLTGATPDNDPALEKMEQNIFLRV